LLHELAEQDDPSDAVTEVVTRLAAEGDWWVARTAGQQLARWGVTVPREASVPSDLPRDLAELEHGQVATVETTAGTFRITLEPELAPLAVSSFARMAATGRYDGMAVTQVIPGFVARTGDPRGDGLGGFGWTIPLELSGAPLDEGVVMVAGLDGEATAGQWFITLAPQPQLRGQHARMGKVSYGMEVVSSLSGDDRVTRVTVEHVRRR
jgi:peptidylprolyl isomerase